MSLSRERIKKYAKLKNKKYRGIQKQFLLEGLRALRDIVGADETGKLIDAVLYVPEMLGDEMSEKLIITVRDRGAKTYEVPRRDLEKIADTVTGQGVVAVINQWSCSIEDVRNWTGTRLLLATDNVREPGNLGSIIRTCDWFGVDALLLGTGTVELWNPKVVRSAVGSMVHLPVAMDVDLVSALADFRLRGYRIVGTSVHGGKPITDVRIEPPAVVVFGSEAEGLSDDIQKELDDHITIPRYGKAESLNVGVAAGVVLSFIRFAGNKPKADL